MDTRDTSTDRTAALAAPESGCDHPRRGVALAALTGLLAPALLRAQPAPVPMEVWKSPTCGCCKDWIDHVQAHGFRVKVHDTGNTAVRERLMLPMKLGSCHTALVGRYAIEGHVPAADVVRLLKEAPDAVGLAVPGMPVGSPGMDGPQYAARRDPFDVLLVARDGSTRIFSSYR
ncbi:MAG: DUF411 domain-containing protein [Rubrivivax sp.]|nr:DUF411 domain-containing protein [Rubrivivax sp.]